MKNLWITYAWADNDNQDVDFIAQELGQLGINIKLDRWNIQSGKRLWEQIDKFITDPNESDGWLLFATPNSLASEPCKEEFAYALNRALDSRGNNFPIIGLFPSSVENSLIPSGIKTRLYVNLRDADWKERIKAAIDGTAPNIPKFNLQPYEIKIHDFNPNGTLLKVIEVRPRAGTWTPSFVGVPLSEKSKLNPRSKYGPKGVYNQGGSSFHDGEEESTDKAWWIMYAQNEVTPSTSLFLICDALPSQIAFGVHNNTPQYFFKII